MKNILIAIALVSLTACSSFNMPFIRTAPDYTALSPDALNQIATEIEQAVQAGNRQPNVADRDGLVVSSAIIQQAIKTRAARAELVNNLLNQGFAREDRNGLVSILNSKEYKKATTSKQRSRDALLVLNENNDRWAIYEGLVKESKLPAKSLSAIQETFHKARLAVMKSGQKYEDESGGTSQK